MKHRFPLEVITILSGPTTWICIYPTLRQLLGQDDFKKHVDILNPGFEKVCKTQGWAKHFLEYGEDILNPILNIFKKVG